jgi:hypothetical protein
VIEAALARGRDAMAIWRDLIDDHGFPAQYASVRRFVITLRDQRPAEAHPVIVTAPRTTSCIRSPVRMPSRPPALYCDEDVSLVLAAMLRARGFPVTTARDAGHLGRVDEHQLQVAADADRILLTHNRADFERLHRQWIESGRRHAGIIPSRPVRDQVPGRESW